MITAVAIGILVWLPTTPRKRRKKEIDTLMVTYFPERLPLRGFALPGLPVEILAAQSHLLWILSQQPILLVVN